ncbi:nitroreductase/quinone reductase family protein [Amycolatopsis sp. 195334CR]|uniref:nitroreductase/quinone reductase family protein n=1 Tax=Amycolatopsis sp. 195334CR TaxID=2814588 RepID=UPI001F5C749B|nr:nitroreductase/quinone reductase family protein [Amycolatopsis sp. 195334CR]
MQGGGQGFDSPQLHRYGHARVVFASSRGAPRDLDWFRNLVANPDVTVEVGAGGHQAMAGRRIPLVVLRKDAGR